MTPEQREMLATAKGYHAAKVFEYRETLDEAMAAKHQRVVDAIAAALAPPPTCGTCKWGVEVFTEHAPPDEVFCQRFSGRRKRDDGCIKGYTPTEPTR